MLNPPSTRSDQRSLNICMNTYRKCTKNHKRSLVGNHKRTNAHPTNTWPLYETYCAARNFENPLPRILSFYGTLWWYDWMWWFCHYAHQTTMCWAIVGQILFHCIVQYAAYMVIYLLLTSYMMYRWIFICVLTVISEKHIIIIIINSYPHHCNIALECEKVMGIAYIHTHMLYAVFYSPTYYICEWITNKQKCCWFYAWEESTFYVSICCAVDDDRCIYRLLLLECVLCSQLFSYLQRNGGVWVFVSMEEATWRPDCLRSKGLFILCGQNAGFWLVAKAGFGQFP